MAGEPIAATVTYHYYRPHLRWARHNMLEAPGGIKDTARKIAHVWDMLWRARREGAADEKPFATPGRWPYFDLKVYGENI